MDFILGAITNTFGILFWFIVILIPLVAIHEMGHFLFSRLVGVKVIEYGIGIPPRAIGKRWKNVIWSLNWLPLGGFAKIYGDHDAVDAAEDIYKQDPAKAKEVYRVTRIGEIIASGDLKYFLEDNNLDYNEEWKAFENYKEDIKPGSNEEALYNQIAILVDWEFEEVINSKAAFCNVSWWRKSFILLGGITFNLITAVVILFVMFGFAGTPVSPILPEDLETLQTEENIEILNQSEYVKVLSVIKDSAAEEVGLEPGDDLISFDGVELTSIQSFDEFADIVQERENPTVSVVYIDADTGVEETKQVDLREEEGQFFFGLSKTSLGYFVSFRSNDLSGAAVRSIGTTYNFFILNFEVLGQVLVSLLPTAEDRSALEQVGGPLAIGSIGGDIFNVQGISGILFIMALVSIALAAFNLLPIPALDGGRFVIVTINAITRRRNKKLESIVIGATFVLMLGLAALIAFYDGFRIVNGTLGF